MGLTGAGIVGMAAAAADGEDPDLVVFNAKVYTVDSAHAEGGGVRRQGRPIHRRRAAPRDIKALIGKGTQTFDAKQMTIVPGFIDCHNHAPGNVLLYEVLVGNPYVVEFVTIASIVEKLRAKAQQTPPGTWVEGFFFDDTKVKDNRLLNVHDLDQVSKDHPVVVHHRGGHTSFYNSKALEMADINKNTPNPPGGTFDRDANGDLNGRVTDRATGVVQQGRQAADLYRRADAAARPRRAGVHLQAVRPLWRDQRASRGRRSVRAAAGAGARRSAAPGELRSQRQGAGVDDRRRHRDRLRRRVDPVRRHFRAHRRRVVLRAHHGAQHAVSRRRRRRIKGNITETQDDLNAWIERVHRAGIQVNCHANGDVAIDMVLTAVERAQRLFPRADARPKITHCTLINDDLVRRIKAAGRGAGAVHLLRLLQLRQVPFLRRRADEALHGVSHLPRRRHSSRRQARTSVPDRSIRGWAFREW